MSSFVLSSLVEQRGLCRAIQEGLITMGRYTYISYIAQILLHTTTTTLSMWCNVKKLKLKYQESSLILNLLFSEWYDWSFRNTWILDEAIVEGKSL